MFLYIFVSKNKLELILTLAKMKKRTICTSSDMCTQLRLSTEKNMALLLDFKLYSFISYFSNTSKCMEMKMWRKMRMEWCMLGRDTSCIKSCMRNCMIIRKRLSFGCGVYIRNEREASLETIWGMACWRITTINAPSLCMLNFAVFRVSYLEIIKKNHHTFNAFKKK